MAIPLHDKSGHLIGYAGRLTKDADITAQKPKYLFPSDRERNGVIHEFHKSLFLYNAQAITEPVSDLIVVEGFPSVWWLWQHGVGNVVCLMGASCSKEQGKLIVGLVAQRFANGPPGSGGRVWVLTDGDESGDRCTKSVFGEVAAACFVRWIRLDEGKQPTDYSPSQILGELTVS